MQEARIVGFPALLEMDLLSPSEIQDVVSTKSVGERLTPMMQQYLDIKAKYADVLLFYRMGDFYELFFDDALTAARILSITLTKRGRHLGQDIPMCGVPVHAADDYLHRLIKAGFNVAICEQIAAPEPVPGTEIKKGKKELIERQVVRLVTPATLTEDKLLEAGTANYLMALAQVKEAGTDAFALAIIDISTGIFLSFGTNFEKLHADIMRFEPKELIVSEPLFHNPDLRPLFDGLGRIIVPQPAQIFDPLMAENRLCTYYQVATLEGFASFSTVETAACAAALAYIEKTQIDARPALMRPQRQSSDQSLYIDPATRLNLELCHTLSGQTKGTLLKAVDRTLTGAGTRLLAERLMQPLCDVEAINARLDSVSFFIQQTLLCEDVRARLKGSSDMLRALARLGVGRSEPRDLATILRGLETGEAIWALFKNVFPPPELQQACQALGALPIDLLHHMQSALADNLPAFKRDGGFISKGYDSTLDDARQLRDQSRHIITELGQRIARETGIKSLKIRHNNMLGFFIEASSTAARPLQENAEFIHRQTISSAMRFTTAELSTLEGRIAEARERALAIELKIFETLCAEVIKNIELIRAGAVALSIMDVSAALAVLAEEQGFCRPVVDDSLAFEVVAGRHLVVEDALRTQAAPPFVANDCHLSPTQTVRFGAIWLLTGPNMGGKSTFLRQNALITIMAQMGAFVPAGAAHIGVVDRLFSRVGASDDLARGRSTFMVEMVETASILNQAGERSLVILDEIGRGTSTFDGLSIAWATLEHLHDVNHCRAIFATHFHEMTVLAEKLPRLYNRTMKVKEWQGDVVFLHEVEAGAADRSYGIQVAKLAGLPLSVVARARDVLSQLEAGQMSGHARKLIDDLPLFSELLHRPNQESERTEKLKKQEKIIQLLSTISPDELTPRQALEALYQLKNLEV